MVGAAQLLRGVAPACLRRADMGTQPVSTAGRSAGFTPGKSALAVRFRAPTGQRCLADGAHHGIGFCLGWADPEEFGPSNSPAEIGFCHLSTLLSRLCPAST